MELVEIGSLGIRVDKQHIQGLNTPEQIDHEINQIATSEIEPEMRSTKDDLIVSPESYIDF